MHNFSFKIARSGVIQYYDADTDDLVFKADAGYVGMPFNQLFKSSQVNLLNSLLNNAFETGKLQSIEFYYDDSLYELKCMRMDDDLAFCIITNNTKQDAAIREIENHNFQKIVDGYFDLVWSFDTNFTLVTANKAFTAMRQRANQLPINIGDNIFKNVKPEVYKKWMPIYDRVLKGETILFEEKRTHVGPEHFVEIYLTPVYDADKTIIGVLGITRDVTQRKRAEEAIAEYVKELEEFAFKTSHELRRPVANLVGLSVILDLEHTNEEDRVTSAKYMNESIMELDDIVTNMAKLIQEYKARLNSATGQ